MSAFKLAVTAFVVVTAGCLLSMSPVGWVMVLVGWGMAVVAIARAGRLASAEGNRRAIGVGAFTLVWPLALAAGVAAFVAP